MSRTGGLVLALVAAAPALAGGYHAPRNAWGAPDLNGLWSTSSLTYLEREDDFKTLVPTEAEAKAYEAKHRGKPRKTNPDDTVGGAETEAFDWETDVGLARIRGQPRSSWIVAPADGKLPYTAAATAANQVRKAKRLTALDGPEDRSLDERCLSPGGPPLLYNGGYDDNYQFVQTGQQLAIMGEYGHDVRVVRIGAGEHPPVTLRSWMGDSIGRWAGDTLVVETTNFTPAEVAAPEKDPAADMKVVERFTRISPTEIFYEFSVTNPARFVQTWRGEMVLNATKGPIYEFACHEGNYSLPDMLSGARHTEAQPPTTAAK
jgi:hypothetical protein